MLSIRFKLSDLRPFRFLLVAVTCAFLCFTQAFPAYAAKSSPTQGEAQLKGITDKAFDAVEAGGPYSRERVQSEANKGLNEVQGTADIDKMNRPENSQGAAPSIEEKVKRGLESIQNKAGDAANSVKNIAD